MDDGQPTGTENYRVIFGGLKPGIEPSGAKRKLADLFKVTPEKIDALLAKPAPIVLKKGISLDIAAKYAAAIESTGGKCIVEPEAVVQPQQSTPEATITKAASGVRSATVSEEKRSGSNTEGPPSWWARFKRLSLLNKIGVVVFLPLITVSLGSKLLGQATDSGQSPFFGTSSDAKVLYRLWQAKNKPEPGAYEDEMAGGELLYECKASGKYPAYFGYLLIKQTFVLTAQPDAKPFPVFVGGVDYGEKLRVFTQPAESGGADIIGQLRNQGCTPPPELNDKARSAISAYVSKGDKAPVVEERASSHQDAKAHAEQAIKQALSLIEKAGNSCNPITLEPVRDSIGRAMEAYQQGVDAERQFGPGPTNQVAYRSYYPAAKSGADAALSMLRQMRCAQN